MNECKAQLRDFVSQGVFKIVSYFVPIFYGDPGINGGMQVNVVFHSCFSDKAFFCGNNAVNREVLENPKAKT